MLRATPPQPRVTCPGTESAWTNGAVKAAEISIFTPPITVTYPSIRLMIVLSTYKVTLTVPSWQIIVSSPQEEQDGLVQSLGPCCFVVPLAVKHKALVM